MKVRWLRDCISFCRSSRGVASSHSTRRAWSSVANCVSPSICEVPAESFSLPSDSDLRGKRLPSALQLVYSKCGVDATFAECWEGLKMILTARHPEYCSADEVLE